MSATAAARPEPVISVWAFRRAPASLRQLFPDSAARDWLVEVPAELAGGPIGEIFLAWLNATSLVSHARSSNGCLVYLAARGVLLKPVSRARATAMPRRRPGRT